MNGRVGALSPVSGDSSDWSGISKYQSLQTDSPYASANAGPRTGALATPPVSTGSSGAIVENGQPGGMGRKPAEYGGNPSPPSSVARSSDGNNMPVPTEESLFEHYTSLKRYLASFLKDETGNSRTNRARDKLLRLSAVQFLELSTDVYDELLRRQSASGARRSGPGGTVQEGAPPFLMPEAGFHPKRNQARQKLSTLAPARFRDLATDVFYELERRFPRFINGELTRPGSASSNKTAAGRNTTSTAGRGPRLSLSRGSTSRTSGTYGRGLSPNENQAPSDANNDYGRPLPKTFQSNTIIPNKSTMVVEEEDDETVSPEDVSEDGDQYDLGRRQSKRTLHRGVDGPPNGVVHGLESRQSKQSAQRDDDGTEMDARIASYHQKTISDLQGRIHDLESQLRDRNGEIVRLRAAEKAKDDALNSERKEWSDLRADLEKRIIEGRNLNASIQSELDNIRLVNANLERDLQSKQHSGAAATSTDESHWKNQFESLQRNHHELKVRLESQEHVTEEVRMEATKFLREMKTLSDQCGASWDREEALTNQVIQLEQQVKEWQNRYARAKTQSRDLRASSSGVAADSPDLLGYARDGGFVDPHGLVGDVQVTKYQIAIDELLRVARVEQPSSITDCMKSTILCVRRILQGLGDVPCPAGDDDDSGNPVLILRNRISAHANNLITVSKAFSSSKGMTPVSLLDATASHLSVAIMELIQIVKIRPTSPGEFDEEDELEDKFISGVGPIASSGFPLDQTQNGGRRFSDESIYSSVQPTQNSFAGMGHIQGHNPNQRY